MSKEAYEYNGVVYFGLAALARGTNRTKSVLRRRLDSGWSVKDAVEKPVQKRRTEPYVYKNVEYSGITALAKAVGMNSATLLTRIDKMGMSVEEAVETPVEEKISIDYGGVHYDTLSAFAKGVNMPRGLVESRYRSGWSIEDIVNKPYGYNKTRCISVGGVDYKDKKSAIEAYGISPDIVRKRKKRGMSFEEAVTTPVSRRVETWEYDGRSFVGLSNVAKYIGVSIKFLNSRLDAGMSFDKVCEEAAAFVEAGGRCNIDYSAYPGCKKPQVVDLKRMLNFDIPLCKSWLTKVFLQSPTEFHGTTYDSVADACSKIGSLDIDVVRARMLRKQFEFQEAVHDRYFVVDNIPFRTIPEMCSYLGVSRLMLRKLCKDCTCKDEVVAIAVKHRGSCVDKAITHSLSMSSKEVSSVTDLKNGMYLVYCKSCNRPIILSADGVSRFKHSEDFCNSHTCLELYQHDVTASQFRLVLLRYGSFEEAVRSYTEAGARRILIRNMHRSSVKTARLVCGGKYMLVHCAVCDKKVLLTLDEAKVFEHSDKCLSFRWE